MNPRTLLVATALASLFATQTALADPIGGEGTFPQFRGLSGLPGGGFGILPDGTAGFGGATAFSTPIAYSLGRDQFVIIGGVYSGDRSFRFDSSEGKLLKSNGTAVGMLGVDLGRYGRLTAAHMVLSTKWDNAQNFHWEVPVTYQDVHFGIGVQDVSGQGGTSGQTSGPRGFDPGESRSYYMVATKAFPRGTYASLGFGDTRFKGRFFGSASTLITPRFKAMGEWDVFGFNTGLAYDLGGFPKNSKAKWTIMAGYLDFKNAYWSLGVSF